jgi:hypothetical protein
MILLERLALQKPALVSDFPTSNVKTMQQRRTVEQMIEGIVANIQLPSAISKQTSIDP